MRPITRAQVSANVAGAGATLLLCACGAGAQRTGALPDGAGAAVSRPATATATFQLVLPARAAPSTGESKPAYVSLSTQSVVVTLTAQNGNAVPSAQPYAVNISNGSGCTSLAPGAVKRSPRSDREPLTPSNPVTCTYAIPAPVGLDTFDVATYDAVQASSTPVTLSGNPLAVGTAGPVTVAENAANTVAVTLNGVIAHLAIVASPASVEAGVPATITLSLVARDAQNGLIVAPGSFATPVDLSATGPGLSAIAPQHLTIPQTTATAQYSGDGCGDREVFTASVAGGPSANVTVPINFDC
jgi:hypothetical protein